MTVKELIEELDKIKDKDMEVYNNNLYGYISSVKIVEYKEWKPKEQKYWISSHRLELGVE